ncbi:hypothetical protein Poli38472_005031 [Pythium oligandrum]|uniref:Uncharacterized protein n=1 Tax=Pythium oligandrum TaxID=41045 RepID=A0A8K1FL84_PYTOL|nr:hypothetical protein Poli38472_005031 [Pythium oligandrum]|eukprot:TMW62413.1 hypothetical protein Poli38472_005031 [Pythium oligandrum]
MRREAALRGVPTPVADDLRYNMWIPASVLTATFKDTEILTSLGQSSQPSVWMDNCVNGNIRDFKCIKNAGISFVCTDRFICQKLGGTELSICGKKFKVQTYSRYTHWYYVDLTRLPDETSDGEIYDWFAEQGAPPVYITPTNSIRGLHSRSRRVYFPTKTTPACFILPGEKPLRQIGFRAGFCVVNHRIRAYNQSKPPFLAALQTQRQELKKQEKNEKNEKNQSKSKPAFSSSLQADIAKSSTEKKVKDGDDESMEGDSEYSPEDDEGGDGGDFPMSSSSEKSKSRGSSFDSDSDPHSDDEKDDGKVVVNPATIWRDVSKPPPNFPSPPDQRSEITFFQVLGQRHTLFPDAEIFSAKDNFKVKVLPVSQNSYPVFATVNPFEWIASGETDDLPPDVDILLTDDNKKLIASTVKMQKRAKELLDGARTAFDVNEMSLEALSNFLEKILSELDNTESADDTIAKIQAQPCFLRPILSKTVPANYKVLESKIVDHAYYRVVSERTKSKTNARSTFAEKLKILFADQVPSDAITALQKLVEDPDEFKQQLRLAEIDLCLQVLAPGIYFDPYKISAIVQQEVTRLSNSRWLLWDDATLELLLHSDFGTNLLKTKIPTQLAKAVTEARARL